MSRHWLILFSNKAEEILPVKPTGPNPPTAPAILSSFWNSCFQQEQQLQLVFTNHTSLPSNRAFKATSLVHSLTPIREETPRDFRLLIEARWKWGACLQIFYFFYAKMHARVIATLRSQKCRCEKLSLEYCFEAGRLSPALQLLDEVFSRSVYPPFFSPHLWSIFFKIQRLLPSVSKNEVCSCWTMGYFSS